MPLDVNSHLLMYYYLVMGLSLGSAAPGHPMVSDVKLTCGIPVMEGPDNLLRWETRLVPSTHSLRNAFYVASAFRIAPESLLQLKAHRYIVCFF